MKRGQFDFPRVQNAQCNARGCMCVHVRVGFTPRERGATVRGQIAEGRLLPPDDRKSKGKAKRKQTPLRTGGLIDGSLDHCLTSGRPQALKRVPTPKCIG